MSKLSKLHFWAWFRRNNEEYVSLKTKSKKEISYWLNELNSHSRAYSKSLYFTMQWNEQASTLIITANGNAKQFERIEDFVAKAPPLAAWKIIALEQPRAIDFCLQKQIEETGIDPRELFFSFDLDCAGGVYLTIYHPLCSPENEKLIMHLARDAVYNLLGERSFAAHIRRIEVANFSEADSASVARLEELPACSAFSKSVMTINADGNLVVNRTT